MVNRELKHIMHDIHTRVMHAGLKWTYRDKQTVKLNGPNPHPKKIQNKKKPMPKRWGIMHNYKHTEIFLT